MSGPFKWGLYRKHVKPLPAPSRAELIKIKHSLSLDADHPLPRCPAKTNTFVKKQEEAGDFSHSGTRRKHICEKCRCKLTAGWGTKHYGVGYCYWHDTDNHRRVSKSMAIALQQGYPLDPIKYKSDSEYIEAIRKMAEDAKGVLGLREELVLLRSHLQEVEVLWKKQGAEAMTMKTAHGSMPMSDDVRLDKLVKLTTAISKLSRDTYVITESDYVHIDEVKVWLWMIWQCVQKNIGKLISSELKAEDLEAAIQKEFKEIPVPKSGRSKR